MRVDGIRSSPLQTIVATASAAEASALMARVRVHHLVVLGRGHKVAGVLSVHDLRGADGDRAVRELMSAPAVTCSARADVREAARLMRRHGVGSLPLTDDAGRLSGIVTASDLLALLGKGAVAIQTRTPKWTMPKRGPTHRPEPRRP